MVSKALIVGRGLAAKARLQPRQHRPDAAMSSASLFIFAILADPIELLIGEGGPPKRCCKSSTPAWSKKQPRVNQFERFKNGGSADVIASRRHFVL